MTTWKTSELRNPFSRPNPDSYERLVCEQCGEKSRHMRERTPVLALAEMLTFTMAHYHGCKKAPVFDVHVEWSSA